MLKRVRGGRVPRFRARAHPFLVELPAPSGP
jgi:hypothetical protein